MATDQLRKQIITQNPPSIPDAARTAVAAAGSLLVAQVFRLPEIYWAAITTLVVMQSTTLRAALPISAQQFAGTAIGAAVGALVGTYFPGNGYLFGLAVFLLGGLCTALRIDRGAHRSAAITLAIVMLIPRSTNELVSAIHRFCEVSIGIAVGLAVTGLWPERSSSLPP